MRRPPEPAKPAPGVTLSNALRSRGSEPTMLSQRGESLPTARSADSAHRAEPTVRSADFGSLMNRTRDTRRPNVAGPAAAGAFAGQLPGARPGAAERRCTMVDEYGRSDARRGGRADAAPLRRRLQARLDQRARRVRSRGARRLHGARDIAGRARFRRAGARSAGSASAASCYNVVRTLSARPDDRHRVADAPRDHDLGAALQLRLVARGDRPDRQVTLHIGEFDAVRCRSGCGSWGWSSRQRAARPAPA